MPAIKKGGRREGAGRPGVDPNGAPSVRVSARLSSDDARLYHELGASTWLREQLRVARLNRRRSGPAR